MKIWILCFFIAAKTQILAFALASTTTLPENYTILHSGVPLEFPKYSQNYTFIDNSSIRANLASRAENDTEIADLLAEDEKNPKTPTPVELKPNPSEVEADLNRKNQAELIENDEDTEGERSSTITETVIVHAREESSSHGPLLGALAGVFLIGCVGGYVGLLTWRRFLETKYGSREMLVVEDEFIDPDDMKHFTI